MTLIFYPPVSIQVVNYGHADFSCTLFVIAAIFGNLKQVCKSHYMHVGVAKYMMKRHIFLTTKRTLLVELTELGVPTTLN